MPDSAVILLVEDRDDDVVLIKRSFEKAFLTNLLFAVRTGEEALDYLSARGRYAGRDEYPLPNLVLLDLKLPGMDGFEVLQWIRSQPGLRSIAVVVLTSSDQLRDVNRAYALGANSFLVKPLEFANYVELSRLINQYWIKTSKAADSFRPAASPTTQRTPEPPV